MSVPSPLDDADDQAEVTAPPPGRARPRKPAPEDPRPFVERYRGTQWDPSPPQPPQVAPRQRRSALTWPVLIGAVVVVLAPAVGGVYALVSSRRPTGLSAFRNTTPAPAQVWVVPTATATGAVDPSSSPVGVAPTPQSWRADSEHPAALFIAQMSEPDLSFHLDANVAMEVQGQAGALEYAMDVSAQDYAVGLTVTSVGLDLNVQMVVKDGYYYARVDDGEWMRGEGAPSATSRQTPTIGSSTWARSRSTAACSTICACLSTAGPGPPIGPWSSSARRP